VLLRGEITVPNSPQSKQLLNQIGLDVIIRCSDEILLQHDSAAFEVLLPLLHTAANDAKASGRLDAQSLFERILRHVESDHNVRAVLASYAAESQDHSQVYSLIHPALPRLLSSPDLFSPILGIFCLAAFERGDIPSAAATYAAIGGLGHHQVAGNETIIKIAERIELINQLAEPMWTTGTSNGDPDAEALLRAVRALDENAMLAYLTEALEATRKRRASSDVGLSWAATSGAIAAKEGWGRPYRVACQLLAAFTAYGGDPKPLDEALQRSSLSNALLHPLIKLAARIAKEDEVERNMFDNLQALSPMKKDNRVINDPAQMLQIALGTFSTDGSIAAARSVWSAAYDAAEFEPLVRYAPGDDAIGDADADLISNYVSAAASVYRPPEINDAGQEVWFYITWHSGIERLFRLYASLHRERTTCVVSIGGGRPLRDHALLSVLALVGNVHLLYRPAVSWGGQKLFFYNVFEALEAFNSRCENTAVFQVICSQTFPLIGPIAFANLMSIPGHREVFAQSGYSIPPPAWHQEWPPETVEDLVQHFDEGLDQVFTTADAASFTRLATFPMIYGPGDFRLNMSAFNFSPDVQTLDPTFKSANQDYMISGHAADLRWMSFGRLTEFIDVMTETGKTISRRFHPRVAHWIHSVLSKHQLRTGDPFVMMSYRFVNEVLKNPACTELFAAMDRGFAPEMNFFDTICYTPEYDLRFDLLHQYYRSATNIANEADIGPASFAADVQNRIFMRKMVPDVSAPFIANFAARIAEENPPGDYCLVTACQASDIKPCLPGCVTDLLKNRLSGLPLRMRNLLGVPQFQGFFQADGRLTHDNGADSPGTWRFIDDALEIAFPWGVKRYQQLASDGRRLILPPSEIVSARNAWSLFLEIELADLAKAWEEPSAIVAARATAEAFEEKWIGGPSMISSVLAAFEIHPPHDYPVPIAQHVVRVCDIRCYGDEQLVLLNVDGFPSLRRLDHISFSNARIVWAFQRGTTSSFLNWPKATSADLDISLCREAIAGSYQVELMEGPQVMTLTADGQLLEESGTAVGRWLASVGSLWLFGMPKLPIACATQFTFARGRWTISGWGHSTLKNIATFRAKQHGQTG
jgi:hypothetical protein